MSLPYTFLLTWTIIPTLLPTLISFAFMPVFFYRYHIFSAIPLLIIAISALHKLIPNVASGAPKWAYLLVAIVIGHMLLSIP